MLNMKSKKHSIFIVTILSTLLISFSESFSNPNRSNSEEIRWQDMELEVDSLPFQKKFIDSLKNAYSVSPRINALRVIQKPIPCVAETLVFQINWGPINAGFVILTTTPDPINNTILLGGKALSNNFVSAFYRMRDYVISTIDADGLYPLFFEQHIREGKKYKADRWVIYDHEAQKAHIQEKTFKTVEIPRFSHDYLSVIYQVRSMTFSPGDTFSFHTYLNKGIHPLFFKCKEKKLINVHAGTFTCTLVEPKFTGDRRAFNKNDKLEVWLADDGYRVPVLIKSKIRFGTITAQLHYQNHSK